MTDDPTPARNVTSTSDDFRRIVRATGDELKDRLQGDLESATAYKGFVDFKLRPYEDLLREVMDHFKEDVCDLFSRKGTVAHSYQEFPVLHGGGDLVWRTIRLITEDASLDKTKYSETPGNPWALPLLVGEHGTVGQPKSLLQSFDVRKGDILLGYNIKRI